jgi:hypothetical protein
MEQDSTETASGVEMIPHFGVTIEEVEAYLTSRKTDNPRRVICVCGHAMSKHSEPDGSRRYCATGRMLCYCSDPKPAIKVEDARYFIRWTHGWGEKHALALGLSAYLKTGKKVEWLIEPVCFVCKDPSRSVFPASVNRGYRISKRCDELNGLFCREHILNLHGLSTKPKE